MKIYFYCKSSLSIQDRFKLELIDCVSHATDTHKGHITDCFITNVDTITFNQKSFDYICVVEDSVKNNSEKKERLDKALWSLVNKTVNKSVLGSTIITNQFDKLSFENGLTLSKNNDDTNLSEELDYKTRSLNYIPTEPSYSFDRVILEDKTIAKIIEAINTIKYENKVFNEWGLKAIQPNPSSALSFFGPSGTGKTMAAEAVASMLGKKILKVGYADIESKYHGEGPKMVKSIFLAAERNDCVLFIDEADSLLSKRLTNVTQGSEQAINSMRSQLLICLEEFKGIVIFATNLVMNYDNAFLTRLISVEFKKPNSELRRKIWDVHLYPTNNNGLNIPLSNDIDTSKLAEDYEFCGREIRKAVVSACVKAAMNDKNIVDMNCLVNACDQIKQEEEALKQSGGIVSMVLNSVNPIGNK